MKRLGILVLFSVLIMGCSKPTDAVIPVGFESEKMEKFGEKIKSLSEENKTLLNSYITRSKESEESEGFPIPIGTTVGEAIEIEKQWQAEVEAEKEARKERYEKLNLEIEEKLVEFNNAVQITFPSLSYNYSSLSTNIRIVNNSDKNIVGIKGRFDFKDKFGDSIGKLSYVINDLDLQPGGVVNREISESTRTSMSADWDSFIDFQYESTPEVLVYDDGTKVKIPTLFDLY
jgi:hypothetical protein